MADEVDVDAMLEAPYQKNDNHSGPLDKTKNGVKSSKEDRPKRRSPGKSEKRKRSRSRDRDSRSSRKERDGDRDRERDRRDRDRGGSDRDRERERERDRIRERSRPRRASRSRSPVRIRNPSPRPYSPPGYRTGPPARRVPGPERRDVMPFTPRYSPPRGVDVNAEVTPEDRDSRTIFCMQLSRMIRPRDLEEFFSSVGRVRDVRIITDSKTRRSKGIGYVEFWDAESVPLAIGLNGQRLLNAPIVIQATQSEKNRMASANLIQTMNQPKGPMKLYIGSLHFNITEEMLRGIFEPFGKIEGIQILRDPETNRSRGYGFVTFHNSEDAKRAMEQLNGFELAGRPIKVSNVTDHSNAPLSSGASLDSDELDRTGIDLGASGRLQLMAKLAEGTGMKLPQSAQHMLNMSQQSMATPSIATPCFMLSNMFDPGQESEPNWEFDIREDVIEECNKHGGVLHIFVDKASPQGNVYVKCPNITTAVAAVNSLHGRYFSGKVITANYVPVWDYHQTFPDAASATMNLFPSSQRL